MAVGQPMTHLNRGESVTSRWSREDVQRVLFLIVCRWESLGDGELFRDAIRIGRETLKDNDWWPEEN